MELGTIRCKIFVLQGDSHVGDGVEVKGDSHVEDGVDGDAVVGANPG